MIGTCELSLGLGHSETRARVESARGSLGVERTVGGGWACGDCDL